MVTTLTIFIENNQGSEDTTKIQKIVLLGSGRETFDLSKREEVLEEQKE